MGFFVNGLEGLKEAFKTALQYKYWIISVLIFGIIAGYFYFSYVVPRFSPTYVSNKEFVRDDIKTTDNDVISPEHAEPVDIIFYYTNWCPYCKKARPEWDRTKEEFHTKIINNYRINFREVDCEEHAELAKNIEGYPTIIMKKDGKDIEYDAKPEYETLKLFINTMLNG